ncbi:metalloprotease [Halorubellus sp. JP-L1]|uniref:metalloprotease n=1 Tax=Halorubellus sp. JP-L1 TaxID=2715753 RepID=UPI00140B5139|nr:metalloprotease [Halorubellus sp. JP-L1]NHN40831.1 metalloprotease [Halorubellus sp. JP-L1]
MRTSSTELRDLGAAWVALSVAFVIFIFGGGVFLESPSVVATFLGMCALTAGVGFLLHELAHKVVAQRFGQAAEFRADYKMLGAAILSAMLGFLFAAPGAVYHRGRITPKENGLIALAGPVTNLVLTGAFFALFLVVGTGGVAGTVASLGVWINAFLAGFNMIPFGPLDGKTVKDWNLGVFAVAFAVMGGLAALVMFTNVVPIVI